MHLETLAFDARTALIPIDVQQGFDLSAGWQQLPGFEAVGRSSAPGARPACRWCTCGTIR